MTAQCSKVKTKELWHVSKSETLPYPKTSRHEVLTVLKILTPTQTETRRVRTLLKVQSREEGAAGM